MSQPLRVLFLLLAEFVGVGAAANHDWLFVGFGLLLVAYWTWRIAEVARVGDS